MEGRKRIRSTWCPNPSSVQILQVLSHMSPPTLSFLNLPLEPTLTRLISLDRLPLDVYLCTHLASFPIPRPLWRQEEPVCPTAYVIHGNRSFTPGFIRWMGGRGEARQQMLAPETPAKREISRHTPNSLTRSQAATLQPVSSKEKLWSADLQPCSEDPKPIHWDCPYQCLTRSCRQSLSPKPILPRPSSEAEPLITLSLQASPYSFPFSLQACHQGGARWDSPSGQGRGGSCDRKPEAGRGAVRTCFVEAGAGPAGRQHGAAVPANAQVRDAAGTGWDEARLGEP